MEQFFQFVIQHWFLWMLFVLLLIGIFWLELRTNVGGVFKIQPQEVVDLINHEHGLVVDVRDEQAFKEGHIINAINIPMQELEQKLKKLQKNKNKPIITVCNQGVSSVKAGSLLRKSGFTQVYTLNGGLNAWKNAGMPLSKG